MKKFFLELINIFFAMALTAPLRAGLVPKRSVLDNGIVLLTSEQKALPMVSIELLIDAGSRYDAPNQEGLANLVAKLLTYGTKRRTALQINETLDFLGASLSTGCSDDLASVSMTIKVPVMSSAWTIPTRVIRPTRSHLPAPIFWAAIALTAAPSAIAGICT